MGYTLDEIQLTESGRRIVLERTFNLKHLPEVDYPEERTHWGAPNSAQRLWVISNLLSAFLKQQKGIKDIKNREKWESDLEWLREAFYHDQMRFDWPS
jgi:hypothetical protein